MADDGDRARMRRIIARLKTVGVVVREIPGWEQRGATWVRVPVGIVDHHDASTRKSGEWGALGVIVEGRSGLPGPLSQFQVARCLDGVPKVAIVAAGRANHAGSGGPYGPVPANSGNSWLYGAEKANDGVDEPMTAAAHYATDALFWAVTMETRDPDLVIGHKEWTPRKIDPKYSMAWRRSRVAGFRPQEDDVALTDEDAKKVADAVFAKMLGAWDNAAGKVVADENGLGPANVDTWVRHTRHQAGVAAKASTQALAQLKVLSAAVTTLAENSNADTATVERAVREAVQAALDDVSATVTLTTVTPEG